MKKVISTCAILILGQSLFAQIYTPNAQIQGSTGTTTTSNVGIGTATPTRAKLQIADGVGRNALSLDAGSSYRRGITFVAGDPAMLFNAYASGTTTKSMTTGYGAAIGLDNLNGSIYINTHNTVTAANTTVTATPRLTITNAGNVGIGTTAPVAMLHVNGKVFIGAPCTSMTNPMPGVYKLYVADGILTEKVRIALKCDAVQWADYVFADDYKLKTLSEVESYVKTNKHLPGIPAAKEVYEQGIDVAEMQAKMLEKVEELTLYIIQLEKEVEKLKQANATK